MHFGEMDPTAVITFMMGNDATDMLTFTTDQMTAKQGMKELEQLVYRKVMDGYDAKQLCTAQKKATLHYLMFLKQKCCG